MEDTITSAADLFLLERWQEDSPLSLDAQREQIFAEFATLGVDGQQPYKDQLRQRGSRWSNLTPEEQGLLDRVRQPASERFAKNTIWLRTFYEPSTDAAFFRIVNKVESQWGDNKLLLLNDPALYDFGTDWHKVFLRIPQLLEYPGSAEDYHEYLREALREESDLDEAVEDSIRYEDENDYICYYWALVVGRIHIVDKATLASEGQNAGEVRIVWYDACGRLVRSYRAELNEAANIAWLDDPLLDDHPCWLNGKVGKDFKWGAPLGPPYDQENLSYRDWRGKVQSAKTSHEQLRKRQADILTSRTSFRESTAVEDGAGSGVQKRWFGAFLNWLKKLNTVESSSVGYLQQYWKQSLLLYRGMMGCSKANAKLSIYLDSEIAMDSTYAYYLSGTLVPPSLDGTYAYFGVKPSVYMGVTVRGDARMQYTSDRRPLISTISYPGLAIKGIAAVGPTLDIYGQIMGVVQISGTMSVGAKYTFEKTEVYWPQDTDGNDYSKINDLVGPPAPAAAGLEPQFQAIVQASADLDILVTPEANIGIRDGGSSLLGGVTLVDAQLVGFVNTTLSQRATPRAQWQATCTTMASTYSTTWASADTPRSPCTIGTWPLAPSSLLPTSSRSTRTVTWLRQRPPAPGRSEVFRPTASHFLAGTETATSRSPGPRSAWLESSNSPATTARCGVRQRPPSISRTQRPSGSEMIAVDVKVTDAEPDFSLAQALTCPPQNCAGPGSSNPNNLPACGWILPDLRYNCKVFADRQTIGPNGQSKIVFGIYTNVQKFFTRRNIPPSEGFVLTWDSDTKRQMTRRPLGLPSTTEAVSCDEFPFASSEEGGNFYPTLQQNPTAVGVTCAPIWEQTLQGRCNQMLSSIATNVNLADNPSATAGSPDALFVPWAARQTDWVSTSAANIDGTTYAGGHIGYYQKRNFTLSLADPSGPSDTSAWGQQSLPSYSGGVTDTDATQVACAINIFDQTDRYQFTNTNGICLTGAFDPDTVYGNTPVWVTCNVQFIGTATNTNSKRHGSDLPHDDEESIGEFSGWKIKKITIPKDAKVVMPAAGYVPEGDMLPFEYEG